MERLLASIAAQQLPGFIALMAKVIVPGILPTRLLASPLSSPKRKLTIQRAIASASPKSASFYSMIRLSW